jgi:hypothetical protein
MIKRMILLVVFSLAALQLFPDAGWNPLTSSSSTPQGRVTQMVYDSGNCCIVLFGGRYGSGQYDNLNDTWIYQKEGCEAKWTNVSSESLNTPPVRRAFSMAYDAKRGVVVMFGGEIGAGDSKKDIWEWNYSTRQWVDVTPTSGVSPMTMGGQMMVYDASLEEVVMFGGWSKETRNWNNDMWRWDGTRWELVTQNSTRPAPRSSHGMVYDQSRQEIVLFGGAVYGYPNGETWVWSWDNYDTPTQRASGSWVQKTSGPSARVSPLMEYDEVKKETIFFGGGDGTTFFNDTWKWDGNTWQQLSPSVNPGSRIGCAAAFAGFSNSMVLFGGWDGTNWLGDTWEFRY